MQAMQKVGVVGLGTMGTGIAIVSMRAGFETVAFDLDAKRLLALQQQSEAFFQAFGRQGQDDARPVGVHPWTSACVQRSG